MDRFVPPFLGTAPRVAAPHSARARPWALPQWRSCLREPILVAIAWLALFVAFASASQDMSSTPTARTWRAREQRGWPARSASWAIAWRCSVIGRGSRWSWSPGSGWIPALGWRNTYLLMAVLMAIGIVAVFWGEEPSTPPAAPRTLRDAVIEAVARILLAAQSRLDPGAARALQARDASPGR